MIFSGHFNKIKALSQLKGTTTSTQFFSRVLRKETTTRPILRALKCLHNIVGEVFEANNIKVFIFLDAFGSMPFTELKI
jgi:hypothetical protein